MDNFDKNDLEFKVKALKKFTLESKTEKVNDIVSTISIPDIAPLISKWDKTIIVDLFQLLDNNKRAELLYNISAKQISLLIRNLSLKELRQIFEELYIDQIIEILENQPSASIKKVFSILNESDLVKVKSLLKFDKNTAGYNMSVDFIKVHDDIDVKSTISEIKRQFNKNESEIVGYVFVVDSKDYLRGIIRIEKLLSSEYNQKITDLIEESPYVYTNDSLEVVKEVVEKYEQSFLPVVNDSKKLIGVIGAEDFISNIITVYENDIAEGGTSSKSHKPYSHQTSFDLFKSRIFWIVILLLIGTITQIMVIGFQLIWQGQGLWSYNEPGISGTVSSLITLGFATSLSVSSSINDASGNSGSQSSSSLIRAIATKDVSKDMYPKIVQKEFNASLMIGIIIALTAIVRMWVVWGIMGQLGDINNFFDFSWYLIISLIASISFFFAIVIGNLIGTILPIMADYMNKDATLFSGPLQTTIVDIITFALYLSLTTLVFVLAADYINNNSTIESSNTMMAEFSKLKLSTVSFQNFIF